ncbi:MAG: hypothetical protein ABS36_14955 [Acidobacteria bacterium SCN 69-37]|nr:MAG: hypothetical protein ABS36_14955 [Acidobacteria bacterium SCN 69-37]
MADRTTPPHVDEIPWGDPAPHPVDILSMTPDLALAEAYDQTVRYRRMVQALVDALSDVITARDAARADRDVLRAEVRRLTQESA